MLSFIKTIFKSLIIFLIFQISTAIASDLEDVKKKAEEILGSIEIQKNQFEKLKKNEILIINRLDDIDRNINKTSKKIATLKKKASDLDEKIKETAKAVSVVTERIKERENYAKNRLSALYKIYSIGKLNIIASADSVYNFFQWKTAMERICSYDDKNISGLISDRESLKNLYVQIDNEKKELVKSTEDYNKQIEALSNEKNKRSSMLSDIRDEKSYKIAVIASLEEAQKSLEQTIDSLNGNIETNLQKPLPKISFKKQSSKFIMPVKGKIISFFGTFTNSKLNVQTYNNGINIKAVQGEPVRAARSGKILYADWLKGYGNVVIVEHTDGFYTVYGHAEDIVKTKGDNVESGDIIATVGETGSLIGPSLYFEVRHRGKPVDPLKWMNINNG
ncbi:MAG: peptidoglycan DD-metalloendopeptidase family protein [Desulfobacterales bacterium]|nr:peptidoglycan DD-metalloendopeptidase family protein [Desulfobacterales bacterium]MBF0396630.1 peptidoglycan DD-metalloendopeptidase family protein [Desulfobacterales bacterium]